MKAAGNYSSLIHGVSQQVPHQRAPGQHTAQVNMLADPVNGITRRHGSQLVAEKKLTSLSVAQFEAYRADTDNWRTLEGSYNFNDYVFLYRTKARPAGASPLPVVIAYHRTSGTFMGLTRNVTDPTLDLLEQGGISAMVMIGRYLFMAGNTIPVVGGETNLWDNPTNAGLSVVWIRAGAMGRTFRATITKTDNTVIEYSVTTPGPAYTGTLTTSDIPASATDYTKQVNDRVNAYNSAVNEHLAAAAYESTPTNMATIGAAQLTSLGVSATALGSHIILNGVKAVQVNDGGDGSLLRGVAMEVESVDKLSPIHFAGKVVKIRTRTSSEAFYMKAIPKREGATGATEVTWVECAGVEYNLQQAFCFGTANANSTLCYIAGSPALLNTLFPGDHPQYAVSTAGDHDSNPAPYVANRQITYLGTFQDRLLVGSGGVIVASKVGDYLNFFRSTMLTYPADDAFEMKSQGPDDDILRSSVLYDQSLIVFGDKRQYMISGKVALTPTNAAMPVMAAYANAALCPPHTAGGLVFYSKRGEAFSSVHQIQPGQGLQNGPESFDASSQIDSYLAGNVIELTSNANPAVLFLRTTGARNSLHTFTYVDTVQGRKLDAWSRWDFNDALGIVIGMAPVTDGLEVYSLREGEGGVYVVCDKCTLTTGLSLRPYLDSQRPVASVTAETGSIWPQSTGPWQAAYTSAGGEQQWIGSSLADAGALEVTYPGVPGLVIGAPQEAYFIPTNPYMKDSKDSTILSGRLTITSMKVVTGKSAGFHSTLTYGTTQINQSFTGRVIGQPTLVGVESINSTEHTVPIGRETRDYSLKLTGRSWLPFTVTALEWTGQFFNRTQRF